MSSPTLSQMILVRRVLLRRMYQWHPSQDGWMNLAILLILADFVCFRPSAYLWHFLLISNFWKFMMTYQTLLSFERFGLSQTNTFGDRRIILQTRFYISYLAKTQAFPPAMSIFGCCFAFLKTNSSLDLNILEKLVAF